MGRLSMQSPVRARECMGAGAWRAYLCNDLRARREFMGAGAWRAYLCSHRLSMRDRAVLKTSSIIGSVNLPVKVFCWLG